MTILASGPNMIACGSAGRVCRLPGRRLPNGLARYVGTPFDECPTEALERYGSWLCAGPDGWCGHSFELFDISDVLTKRGAAGEREP